MPAAYGLPAACHHHHHPSSAPCLQAMRDLCCLAPWSTLSQRVVSPLDLRSTADSNFIMSRALFVKNLRFVINPPSSSSYLNTLMLTVPRSYNVTPEELFELFGKYGPIRYVAPPIPCWPRYTDVPRSQVRQGIASNTKGTAFVVYEDVMDAKQACDKLNGFNFQGRYLVGESTFHSCPAGSRRPFPLTQSCSTVPPAREDGQVKRGPRGTQGEFSAAQEAARHRLTI